MKNDRNSADSRLKKTILTGDIINAFGNEFYWLHDKSGKDKFFGNLYEVTGYSDNDISSLKEIIFEDDREGYNKFLDDLQSNRSGAPQHDFRILTSDGRIKQVSENVRILYDNDGKISKIIGRVIDVSEENKSDILYRDKLIDELRNKNLEKENFINLLSHDLRSPFTSILGFSEILIKDPSLAAEERNEYLSYIHSASERLLQLINYLLDWSRLQTGKLQIERRKINLQILVHSCVSSLKEAAVGKNIEIITDIDKSFIVNGDERLLNIVITNLLSNSIKYSRDGSRVYVRALSFNQELIELIVRDEGIGIPEVNKIKIFKFDKMFSTPGTAGEKGTGFCSTLSKLIVEKHGGDMWFYSKENEGSEFHITLPRSPYLILVVEPDPMKRSGILSFLEEQFPAYKITAFRDFHEAIDNMSNILPSAIILHHQMPLVNGVHFIETLLSEKQNTPVKIIVLDNNTSEDDRNKYLSLGVTVFLGNNTTEEKLAAALRNLLEY